jgi:hypothetical protein
MHVLDMTCDKMEDEIEQIIKKPQLTTEDVKLVYQMIDVIKDITTIEAMKKAETEGWSGDYDDNSYRMSYARGRDSMGRYTSRDTMTPYRGGSYDDGYSRHSKEEMINNLRTMMDNARTPEERESYRATIEQMSR